MYAIEYGQMKGSTAVNGPEMKVPSSFQDPSIEQTKSRVEKPKSYKLLIELIMLIGTAFCAVGIILIVYYAAMKKQKEDRDGLPGPKNTDDDNMIQSYLISSCVFFGLGGISCIISIILNLREQDS